MKILHMKSVKRFYVKFFNGFCLEKEEIFFDEYIDKEDTCIVGFSYGAQKALEYVYQSDKRIDKLILLSPAFFQREKPSFIRTQLHYFEVNQDAYIENFLANVSYPSQYDLSKYLHIGSNEELNALLSYQWDKNKIEEILNRETSIEVFLGDKDKIIDVASAKLFFIQTTTYIIKDAGHLLKGNE